MNADPAKLSIRQINELFFRNFGSKRALAREAGVSAPYISNLLRGNVKNDRVLALAREHARQYLDRVREEKEQKRAEREQKERKRAERSSTRQNESKPLRASA